MCNLVASLPNPLAGRSKQTQYPSIRAALILTFVPSPFLSQLRCSLIPVPELYQCSYTLLPQRDFLDGEFQRGFPEDTFLLQRLAG